MSGAERHERAGGASCCAPGEATESPMTRAERRALALQKRGAERRHLQSAAGREATRRSDRMRKAGFGIVAAIVLGGGAYLAAGDLLGQRATTSAADAIPVQMSMAGFTPSEIRVPAGQPVEIELWTTDAAPHLDGGVHTMISDELGIYEELPAAGPTGESRRMVRFMSPTKPGSYDIYCDTCCGGRASPTMHGRLVVES